MMNGTFTTIICSLVDLLLMVLPILYGLAFLTFFWGLFKFIKNADNKDEVSKGKDYMMWSVVVLFILLTFRIIISLISQEFEFGNASLFPFLNDGEGGKRACGVGNDLQTSSSTNFIPGPPVELP